MMITACATMVLSSFIIAITRHFEMKAKNATAHDLLPPERTTAPPAGDKWRCQTHHEGCASPDLRMKTGDLEPLKDLDAEHPGLSSHVDIEAFQENATAGEEQGKIQGSIKETKAMKAEAMC